MGVLEEIQQDVAAAVATIGPSVVGIGGGWARGCGVVIGDNRVLTNAHNVQGGEVAVTFNDGRTTPGNVTGVDIDGDLAVISVDTAGASPVQWSGDDQIVQVGTPVLALANPGGRGLRVTLGLVSAMGRSFRGPRGRRVTRSIEHTAPMGRGSSGGPIVSTGGNFLGLNTNRMGEGFYLAIPADTDMRTRVDALATGHNPNRRHLGLGLVPGRAARRLRRAVGLPDRDGVLVQLVEDDSPAARAGVRSGDLIVAAGGQSVAGIDDLYDAVDHLGDDDSLALDVVRGADELAVTVTF